MSPNDPDASAPRAAPAGRRGERDLDDLLVHVGRGDQPAFEAVYDRMAGPVYGVIRRVLHRYSYRQVAGLLSVTLGAIKTRIRDGLIRMRDCLGVS